MRRPVLMTVIALVLAACAKSKPAESPQKQPLTERQRDSVIGASRLPGAGAVNSALRISDTATAKRAREDSISSQP
jgi:putative VirB-like lipoprotein